MSARGKSGFSFLEVLIVVAIIAIIASITAPAGSIVHAKIRLRPKCDRGIDGLMLGMAGYAQGS